MSDLFRRSRLIPVVRSCAGAVALIALSCGGQQPGREVGRPGDDAALVVPTADALAPRDLAAPADTGLSPVADAAGATPDASSPTGDAPAAPDTAGDSAPGPATVLLFTRATGFVHDSRGPAAMALKRALAPFGVTATISEDPALVSASSLAAFGAVVLIDTTGMPFGDPGTAAIDALAAFVRGGRGLVGVHAASNGHETSPTYVGLIGGDFTEHPGGVRMGRCQPEGNHPSVARLPPTFTLVDEFYLFRNYRNDNIVDLRCDAVGGGDKLPIAWHRTEGQGRVFYTALGHSADEWSDRRIVEDHVVPGILWTLGR